MRGGGVEVGSLGDAGAPLGWLEDDATAEGRQVVAEVPLESMIVMIS